jgi:predicted site-specific integrase-resolvase
MEVLDAKGLAAKLRVRTATVRSWARRGLIPCLRASRRPVLFDMDDVERALKERGARLEVARQS